MRQFSVPTPILFLEASKDTPWHSQTSWPDSGKSGPLLFLRLAVLFLPTLDPFLLPGQAVVMQQQHLSAGFVLFDTASFFPDMPAAAMASEQGWIFRDVHSLNQPECKAETEAGGGQSLKEKRCRALGETVECYVLPGHREPRNQWGGLGSGASAVQSHNAIHSVLMALEEH